MPTLRTRFAKEIVAEFLPPRRLSKPGREKVIIVLDGLPVVPSKFRLLEFFSKKGYWAFHVRYRGTWESGGSFLRRSPHEDVLAMIDGLSKGFKSFGKFLNKDHFKLAPKEIILFGASFAGPAMLLAARDPRVSKVVALSPVVDWQKDSKTEPLNRLHAFISNAFGAAYRGTKRDWQKLSGGKFYNPVRHVAEIDGRKVLIMHAKDDDVVLFKPVARFAKQIGATFIMLPRGGHLSSSLAFKKPVLYRRIQKFLKQK